MCAIFGSNDVSMCEVLYDANVQRGNFASSIVTLYEKEQQVIKKQGSFNFDELKLDERGDYYIGHVQAPTSAKRDWSYDTSHPFESLSWQVIHNGVLSNWYEIRAQHIDWDINPVDTSVIPNLLQNYTELYGHLTQTEVIKMVLRELEGTFALCITNTDTNDVYLARQGSILHYNDRGDFSSVGGVGFKVVPEGVIMHLRGYNYFDVVETFESQSPFLFL